MHLERANSTSHEASVAGWISSNDVAIVTVVVMVVSAIFLQSTLNRRTNEKQELLFQKDTLIADKASLTSERTALQDESQRQRSEIAGQSDELHRRALALADAKKMQELLADDRDTALRRLSDESSSLQATRDDLSRTRTDLSQTKTDLANRTTERNDLTRRLASLEDQHASLNKNLLALNDAKERLEKTKAQELAAAAAKLEVNAQEFEKLQRERNLLFDYAKQLRDRFLAQQADLETARKESAKIQRDYTSLDETLRLLRQTLDDSKRQLSSTEQDLAARDRAVKSSIDEKRLLELQLAALQAQFRGTLDQIGTLKQQLKDQEVLKYSVHRQLIGLSGGLRRVAVLVDSSGSMALEKGRWEGVREIVVNWLAHLDVDQCVLVLFNSNVTTFPGDGTLLDLRGPQGAQNRERLVKRLKDERPGGWTNTLAAFETAYRHPGIDTILLFTDGKPTTAASDRIDPEAVRRIYALCTQNRHIPVNAIGIGDYFEDKELSQFLRRLAQTTSGTFLGR